MVVIKNSSLLRVIKNSFSPNIDIEFVFGDGDISVTVTPKVSIVYRMWEDDDKFILVIRFDNEAKEHLVYRLSDIGDERLIINLYFGNSNKVAIRMLCDEILISESWSNRLPVLELFVDLVNDKVIVTDCKDRCRDFYSQMFDHDT